MNNLVATTPTTAKAMENLYAELNRQKDIKQTYRKKYKDLQAVVTTTEHTVTLQQPAVVMNNIVKASPQVLKVTLGGKGKGPIGKGKGAKPKPLNKGKKIVAKPSLSKTITSTSPSMNPRDKAKDQPKMTVTMIQDLAEELQTIE